MARMIKQSDLFVSTKVVLLECLKDIEAQIGEMNQPSVEDIFEDKTNRI